jgi:hypothetical protein
MRIRRLSVLHLSVATLVAVGCRSRAAIPESGLGQVAADAPEVRQHSFLDCGPAALQSVLQGFGVQVEYETLVHLLAVDPVEGASIDSLEEVANRFGVEAQQVMIPPDYLFLPGGHDGPMIAIATAPGALKHFLVLWRAADARVQVMDPSTGLRTWVGQSDLRKRLYVHEMAVPAKAWKEWSHGVTFRDGVFARMVGLGMPASAIEHLWTEASTDTSLTGLQALDAAVRLTADGPRRTDVASDLEKVFECSRNLSCSGKDRAPAEFWSAWDSGATDSNGEAQITVRGVVLLNFYGRARRTH